jgi:peptidoglycan DL-endopeptidase LytE
MKWFTTIIIAILTFTLFKTDPVSAEYTVKPGDTLWKISQQTGTPYRDLLSLNPHIDNPSLIHVGDYLIIRTKDKATDIVDFARALQDKTVYVYGGQDFVPVLKTDCSGWTQYIYGKFNVKLPRTSREQAKVGTPIKFGDMKKGDLMFFSTRADKVITHVGIYTGGNYWISNLNAEKSVVVLSTWGSWTQKYFLWATRVI